MDSRREQGMSESMPVGDEGARCIAGYGLAGGSVSETLDGDELEVFPYSIRMPVGASEVRCPGCQTWFRAEGPTGFGATGPICDLCLLQGCHGLGMLLALASVARSYGRIRGSELGEKREALEELWAFTRIYESVAARNGPPRSFGIWTWGGADAK